MTAEVPMKIHLVMAGQPVPGYQAVRQRTQGVLPRLQIQKMPYCI